MPSATIKTTAWDDHMEGVVSYPAKTPTMAERLQRIADERGVRDPLHINVWGIEGGQPSAMPGRFVPIESHRADGRPPLPSLPPHRPRK
jgi:hypothetical protein